jgi:hypothetical protein
MRSSLSWAAAALLCIAPAVRAQDACAENLKWPKVGTWAAYEGMYDEKTPMKTRYAVVGAETREGTDYKWVEFKTHDEKRNKDMIYQMLVPGGGPLEMEGIQEVVIKVGTDPATKMSGMMMKMIRGQLAKNSIFKDICTDAALVGKEKVSVPAGSFRANHYHSAKYETDSWVDAKVPFSMVKSVGKKHNIALMETGTGAESSITETPKEMPGMGPSK